MNRVKINFSNGTHLYIDENQVLLPICKYVDNKSITTYKGEPTTIWSHTNDGLIPSLTEFFCNCEFFEEEVSAIVYKVSAIVSIELA